jgi:hypothetical protein
MQLHSTKRACDDTPLTGLAGTATAALSYGSQDTDALSTDWLHNKEGESGTKRLGRNRNCCCTSGAGKGHSACGILWREGIGS